MSVTVLVPTYNESGNVAELVSRVTAVAVAADVREILFVDDSTDHTPRVIAEVAQDAALPVRLIHRTGADRAGGLSGAVVAVFHHARSEWVLVMDADLQHPPEDLPRIVRATRDADLVVASRYRDGGDAGGLANRGRRLISTTATRVSRLVFPVRLEGITDPMTGFFAVRRWSLDMPSLRPEGFKILLEILARHQMRVVEVPFAFADRLSGRSKASMLQGARFVHQLGRLRVATWRALLSGDARTPSSQRLRFGLVGLLNVVVDVTIFNVLLLSSGRPLTAKLVASGTAVASSYVLNRRWTWRHRAGRRVEVGLPAFLTVAAVGLVVAESCLLTSHYVLGLTSPLADNLSANVIGLGLGMLVRYRLCDRWVFRAPAEAAVMYDAGRPCDGPVHS